MELSKKNKAMLASYARAVAGAASTLYIAGVTDPKDLWAALVGALIPVAVRYVNPNDAAFGRMPKVSEVEAALKAAKPRKKKSE
jgi:hypothetical protein